MANAGFSSRHMPAPGSHAAKWRSVVNRSEDVAEGIIEKNASRQFSLDRVTLRTRIAWEGNAWEMSRADELQHSAHEECFDANSVRAEIRCEPLD